MKIHAVSLLLIATIMVLSITVAVSMHVLSFDELFMSVLLLMGSMGAFALGSLLLRDQEQDSHQGIGNRRL